MNNYDFRGRVAVISGGCGGIGRAVGARLTQSGATVVVWDIADSADRRLDLTSESDVSAATVETIAKHGRLDILINCAGVTGPTVPIEAYSLKDWRRTLDINLDSTFLCCRAAIPQMRRQNYGRIVNLASIAGKEGNANMIGYSAAKGAVIAFTKAVAKELATTEVRVNAVAPAVIATELVKQMSEETYKTVVAKIPVGRPGRPEEVASLICWLASEECSFSTGAVFDLSGGRATY